MLAFIFRGVFLVGVLSWYSTSVWKMIDVYFRNRFDSYLRAEYDKNPHMLADLKAYRAAAGKESPDAPVAEPEENLNEVLKACSADLCPLTGHADNLEGGKPAASKEASGVDLVKPETTTSIPTVTGGEEDGTKVEASPEAISGRPKNDSKKKIKKKTRRSPAGEAVKVEDEKTATKRLKTITLTKKDFDSTRIKVTPQDFAEFDRDEEKPHEEEDEADSVLVSELPFKPKADIGDLKRVSPEEFCPVTLDDEFSCEETKSIRDFRIGRMSQELSEMESEFMALYAIVDMHWHTRWSKCKEMCDFHGRDCRPNRRDPDCYNGRVPEPSIVRESVYVCSSCATRFQSHSNV